MVDYRRKKERRKKKKKKRKNKCESPKYCDSFSLVTTDWEGVRFFSFPFSSSSSPSSFSFFLFSFFLLPPPPPPLPVYHIASVSLPFAMVKVNTGYIPFHASMKSRHVTHRLQCPYQVNLERVKDKHERYDLLRTSFFLFFFRARFGTSPLK